MFLGPLPPQFSKLFFSSLITPVFEQRYIILVSNFVPLPCLCSPPSACDAAGRPWAPLTPTTVYGRGCRERDGFTRDGSGHGPGSRIGALHSQGGIKMMKRKKLEFFITLMKNSSFFLLARNGHFLIPMVGGYISFDHMHEYIPPSPHPLPMCDYSWYWGFLNLNFVKFRSINFEQSLSFYLRPKADRSWSNPSCCWDGCCWGGTFF